MKKTITLLKNIFLASVFFTVSIQTAQPVFSKTINKNQIEKIMGSYYKKDFNGVILVSQKGKIVYEKANGISDYKTKKPLTIDSTFNLASVSKQFTAMGIMILKEKGKLTYNDSIMKYLPNLPYKNVTIENLVHHTSGLPDYLELVEEKWDAKKMLTNNDVVALFSKYKPKVVFTAGKKYEYSNTGYAFLASIIEKASGQTFDQFMS